MAAFYGDYGAPVVGGAVGSLGYPHAHVDYGHHVDYAHAHVDYPHAHVDYAHVGYPHVDVVAPAPVVAAPLPVAHAHHSVEAWGRPVWKKKWLLGKWKYAGLKDVQYIPRTGVHAGAGFGGPIGPHVDYVAPGGYGGYGTALPVGYGGAAPYGTLGAVPGYY